MPFESAVADDEERRENEWCVSGGDGIARGRLVRMVRIGWGGWRSRMCLRERGPVVWWAASLLEVLVLVVAG